MAAIETLDSEIIQDLCQKKIKKYKKPDLVAVAETINGGKIVESFEQIGRPIAIESMTMDQIKRFVVKKVTNSGGDVAKIILGDTVNVNINTCSICLDLMANQRNSLECGHWVHWKCFEKTDGTCPICRKNVIASLPSGTRNHILNRIDRSKLKDSVYSLALFN